MTLEIRKGDTLEIEISLKNNGEPFVPENEKIMFSVGNGRNAPYFVKQAIDGIVKINHEDTANMAVGEYKYDVRVYDENKILVATPLVGSFKILEVVNNDI